MLILVLTVLPVLEHPVLLEVLEHPVLLEVLGDLEYPVLLEVLGDLELLEILYLLFLLWTPDEEGDNNRFYSDSEDSKN
jgi:hypothetical protein